MHSDYVKHFTSEQARRAGPSRPRIQSWSRFSGKTPARIPTQPGTITRPAASRSRYVNVKKNADGLDRMLRYSNGRRQVPVIVEDGKVTIGFGGT